MSSLVAIDLFVSDPLCRTLAGIWLGCALFTSALLWLAARPAKDL